MTSRHHRSVLKKITARRASRPAIPAQASAAARRQPADRPRSLPALWSLTRREMEILRLVATGETDRGIAESLFLSHRTVSNHVSSILGKLDVPTRRAAVLTAMRVGLL
jgi:DNA-binding NarL/FixJ family response regulator